MKHNNRRSQQDRSGKGKVKHNRKSRRETERKNKQEQGNLEIATDQKTASENYKLSWFKPTITQKEIIESMCCNELTAVQGSSGTGKSTTVIWQALQDIKGGHYSRIVFVKTPDESGDDPIGYLKGDGNEKLEPHFEAMRSIFHTFMSKPKLSMEEKKERIVFTIPNFIKGRTYDHALIIIDEAQSISPKTMKCILERAGESTRIVILGDKNQCYSSKHRADGFTDFINKITIVDENNNTVSKEPTMGYIRMTAEDNVRSNLSKRIVELYED